MQLAYRQGGDERVHLGRRDHEQAIGLAPVAGDLGEELVRRHPGRHGDVQLRAHPLADVLGDARGAAGKVRGVGHVQIGFVQRQRFDQLGVVLQDGVDLLRGRLVRLETWAHDQQLRAQCQCRARGHRRVHAEGTRLVVAGGDHAAPIRRTAHGHGTSGQTRVVAHLDGGEEAVAVNVDDLAHDKPANRPDSG
ncbi:hypothetical protein D3C75_851010 [compost metagenome]